MSKAKAAQKARLELLSVRIDKWLWAARFYKTRSLASKAVGAGHVQVNGNRIKPAFSVKPGDRLSIRISETEREIDLLQLAERRGSAAIARTLYTETEASILKRETQQAERRAERLTRPDFGARPDKKERRERMRFTGRSG